VTGNKVQGLIKGKEGFSAHQNKSGRKKESHCGECVGLGGSNGEITGKPGNGGLREIKWGKREVFKRRKSFSLNTHEKVKKTSSILSQNRSKKGHLREKGKRS